MISNFWIKKYMRNCNFEVCKASINRLNPIRCWLYNLQEANFCSLAFTYFITCCRVFSQQQWNCWFNTNNGPKYIRLHSYLNKVLPRKWKSVFTNFFSSRFSVAKQSYKTALFRYVKGFFNRWILLDDFRGWRQDRENLKIR